MFRSGVCWVASPAGIHAALILPAVLAACVPGLSGAAESDDIDRKLDDIDRRLHQLEEEDRHADDSGHLDKALNPAISVILDGVYASYKNDPDDYNLPGFMPGGDAGLAPEGFSLGHSEIIFSGNIDDKFFAQAQCRHF